jgi:tyrosine-protein phosphatase YwqE
MFWISKKIVSFSEVWKDGFVDLHNHLLPGIDDGSETIDQTLSMILGMQELGITEAIATPHTYPGMWPNTKTSITEAYEMVPSTFITDYSSEYLADSSLLDLMNNNELLPMHNNHLLIEFSMMSAPFSGIMDVLYSLKLKGYRLILAHPERYLYWDNNLEMFEKLKSFELEFQLNAMSLIGFYGDRCKKIAEHLLTENHFDYLGTDFHNLHHIKYTKNHTFNEKYLKNIMYLVNANQKFSTNK